MSDDEHIAVTNTVWVNVIEITKERDELRAENEELNVLLRNNQERREEVEARHGDLLRDNEQLRAALEKIATSPLAQSWWLVKEARDVLGKPNC